MVIETGRSKSTAGIGLSMSIPELLAIIQYSVNSARSASTILDNLGVSSYLAADENALQRGFTELMKSHVMEMDYTSMVPRFVDINVNTPDNAIGSLILAKILSGNDSFISIRLLLGKARGALQLFSDDTSWVLMWMQGSSSGNRRVSLSYGLSKANMVDTVWSKMERHFSRSTPGTEITATIVRVRTSTGEIMSGTSLFGSNPEFQEPELADPSLSRNVGPVVVDGLYFYPDMGSLRRRVENILEVI